MSCGLCTGMWETVITQAVIISYHSVYTESESQKLICFKLGRFLAVIFFSTKTVNTAKMLRLKASKIKSPLRSSLPILVLVFSYGKFRQVAVVCRSCYWDIYQVQLNCISRKSHCRDGWEMFYSLTLSSGYQHFLLLFFY